MVTDFEDEDLVADPLMDGVAGTHPERTPLAVRVAPSTSREFNTIATDFRTIACVKLADPAFRFDSSFVRPGIAEEMSRLAGLRDLLKRDTLFPPVAIFGHADPVGNEEYNKALSGRRAKAVYAMLIRDADMWEELYSQPMGGDHWGSNAIENMLGALDFTANGQPGSGLKKFQALNGLTGTGFADLATRKALYLAYMDFICGKEFKLDRSKDFLARGTDPKGKGDFQGCGEFNPLRMFSRQENDELSRPQNKARRDAENECNRRVLIYLYRPGDRVLPDKWPCPRAAEGGAACHKRFFQDAPIRHTFQEKRREHQETQDTFSCRFYQFHMARGSPCEIAPDVRRMPTPVGDAEDIGPGVEVQDLPLENNVHDVLDDLLEPFGKTKAEPLSFSNSKAKSATVTKGPAALAAAFDSNARPTNVNKQALINGQFHDKGQFTANGEFNDPILNQLLKDYAKFWQDANGNKVDSTNPSGGVGFALPKLLGGDTRGSDITELPAWFKLFQNRLIGIDTIQNAKLWDDDCRATQRLLQAYMNAFTTKHNGKVHPSLQEFYLHIGKSETNRQAGILGGRSDAGNWCAAASNLAFIRGVFRKGVRFKRAAVLKPKDNFGAERKSQLGEALFIPGKPDKRGPFQKWREKTTTTNQTNSVSGDTTALKPGDIITVVNGGPNGPLSGHVATVIKELPGEGGGISRVWYVSGNAAGARNKEGAIRVEQVFREHFPPKPDFDYFPEAQLYNEWLPLKQGLQDKTEKQEALIRLFKSRPLTPAEDVELAKLTAEVTALRVKADRFRKRAKDKNLPLDRDDADRFRAGVHAPKSPDRSWVVVIVHTSRIDVSDAGLFSREPDLEGGHIKLGKFTPDPNEPHEPDPQLDA